MPLLSACALLAEVLGWLVEGAATALVEACGESGEPSSQAFLNGKFCMGS
jgi:hypothetical protein